MEINNDSWFKTARKEQLIPNGDWKIWLLLAGRGFGKTRAGSEAIIELIKQKQIFRIGLIGAVFHDVRFVMIEGESGLLKRLQFYKIEYTYFPKKREIFLKKHNIIIQFFSSFNPDSLRGFQFDFVWIDELTKFSNPQEFWTQICFCLRLGISKMIITTTPKNIALLNYIINLTGTIISYGSSYDNQINLSDNFVKNIEEYENTSTGEQEIHGKIVNMQNIWTVDKIIYKTSQNYKEYVLGIDPAVISGTTGIILIAIDDNNDFYIIEDFSSTESSDIWMLKIEEICLQYPSLTIAIEINQGGEILMNALRLYKIFVPIALYRATTSKSSRNFLTLSLYNQSRVFHIKLFRLLEREMLNFPADRVDALTWAIYHIITRHN